MTISNFSKKCLYSGHNTSHSTATSRHLPPSSLHLLEKPTLVAIPSDGEELEYSESTTRKHNYMPSTQKPSRHDISAPQTDNFTITLNSLPDFTSYDSKVLRRFENNPLDIHD